MHFIALTSRSTGSNEAALSEETRRDLSVLDAALASQEKRALAEAALHVAARILEEAEVGDDEASPLSKREVDALGSLGIEAVEAMADADFYRSRPVVRGAAHRAKLVSEAVPLAMAARRIGVSGAHLRERIEAGSLMAIRHPQSQDWLIPSFQLTDTGEIPHLDRVLKAAGRPISAEAMQRLFTTSHQTLGGQSPRAWLAEGRDPAIIEDILASL